MKLAAYLKAHEISLSDFARKIRVKQPTVSRYLAGERIPDQDTMKLIVRETRGQVTPNDFYGVEQIKAAS